MRDKSVQKLKDKVRELTQRKFNLDAKLVEKLNRILRSTAQYFAAPFAHCKRQFRRLDGWIRMRLRCMKFKRKWVTDHYRLRRKFFDRKGVLCLVDFCCPA